MRLFAHLLILLKYLGLRHRSSIVGPIGRAEVEDVQPRITLVGTVRRHLQSADPTQLNSRRRDAAHSRTNRHALFSGPHPSQSLIQFCKRKTACGVVEEVEAVVLTDFDGTMVTIDTAEYLLDQFAKGNWRTIDEQLEKGEVSFEESLKREFAMLKVPERTILQTLEPVTQFRPNFDRLIEYCKERSFTLVVVSGGLDFSIRHFLRLKGWLNSLEIVSPKATCTQDGIRLSFPKRLDQTATNLKDDLVWFHKKQGRRVVYIGNGIGDYPAAKVADLAFAIKGSKLAQLCQGNGTRCTEITDFQDAVNSIRDWFLAGASSV
jgi:2-hydroxy-3-keto-5-methylthiopentenyl-1-phosphate phosphatase